MPAYSSSDAAIPLCYYCLHRYVTLCLCAIFCTTPAEVDTAFIMIGCFKHDHGRCHSRRPIEDILGVLSHRLSRIGSYLSTAGLISSKLIRICYLILNRSANTFANFAHSGRDDLAVCGRPYHTLTAHSGCGVVSDIFRLWIEYADCDAVFH